jgi:hypothetical protein
LCQFGAVLTVTDQRDPLVPKVLLGHLEASVVGLCFSAFYLQKAVLGQPGQSGQLGQSGQPGQSGQAGPTGPAGMNGASGVHPSSLANKSISLTPRSGSRCARTHWSTSHPQFLSSHANNGKATRSKWDIRCSRTYWGILLLISLHQHILTMI